MGNEVMFFFGGGWLKNFPLSVFLGNTPEEERKGDGSLIKCGRTCR